MITINRHCDQYMAVHLSMHRRWRGQPVAGARDAKKYMEYVKLNYGITAQVVQEYIQYYFDSEEDITLFLLRWA